MTESSTCPGCGLTRESQGGPLHEYVVTSPECWALFNEILPNSIERLFTDAYMAQHPDGTDSRQKQSVAAHLITLYCVLELEQPVGKASSVTSAAVEHGRRGGGYPKLNRPADWPRTIDDIELNGEAPYISSVLETWLQVERSRIERWSGATIALLYR